jgi:hypothetical protein
MTQDRDDMIRSYVSRVMEVRERREDAMSAEELRAIARDIGLSDEDLAAAERESVDHAQRGRQFLQHDRLNDGIDALQKSLALAPAEITVRLDLARALRDRYRASHNPQDRTQAAAHARRCIEQDPACQPAYPLLNELDAPPPSSNKAIPLVLFAVFGAVSVLGLAALAALFFAVERSPAPGPIPQPADPEVVAREPVVATPLKPASPSADAITIPMEIKLPQGATLDAQLLGSRHDYYDFSKTGYYKFNLALKNTSSDKQISAIDGTLTLLDASGKHMLADSHAPLSESMGTALLPGDTLSLSRTKELKQTPARAVFEIKTVKTTLAPPDMRFEAAPMTWDTRSAFEQRLTINERSSGFKRYNTNDKGYFTLLIEARLSGDTPIEQIKWRLETFDAAGKLLAQTNLYFPGIGDGALLPDTVRAHKHVMSSEQDVASYKLVVEEIK